MQIGCALCELVGRNSFVEIRADALPVTSMVRLIQTVQ